MITKNRLKKILYSKNLQINELIKDVIDLEDRTAELLSDIDDLETELLEIEDMFCSDIHSRNSEVGDLILSNYVLGIEKNDLIEAYEQEFELNLKEYLKANR